MFRAEDTTERGNQNNTVNKVLYRAKRVIQEKDDNTYGTRYPSTLYHIIRLILLITLHKFIPNS